MTYVNPLIEINLNYQLLQPPSEGELSVPSGILGRIHKWRNESTVIKMFQQQFDNISFKSFDLYSHIIND